MSARSDDVALVRIRTVVGRGLTDAELSSVARRVRVYGADWTEKAVLEARARGKDMCLAYIAATLRNWGQHGCVCR